MNAIFSIEKKYSDLILSGYKNIEFRNVLVKLEKDDKVYIYETKKNGCGMIVGYFIVDKIEEIKKNKIGTYNFMVDYAKKFSNKEIIEHIEKASKINLKNHYNCYVLSWLFNEKIIDYMLLTGDVVNIKETLEGGKFEDNNEFKQKREKFCDDCDDWLKNIGYYNDFDEAYWKYKIYIKKAIKITPMPITEFHLLNGKKINRAPQSFCYTS